MVTNRIKGALIVVISSVPYLGRILKHSRELDYWKSRKRAETRLGNTHYEYLYTTYFEIDREFYRGKCILDIGCGPRGSLEWAYLAKERIGLDPLVAVYRKLGVDEHKMQYCDASSESIPFPDAHFDVVSSINSLDHVDDVQRTICEIARVAKPGGVLLLIVEVKHRVRICEPHSLPLSIIDQFLPWFTVVKSDVSSGETVFSKGPYSGTGPGWISAILCRKC